METRQPQQIEDLMLARHLGEAARYRKMLEENNVPEPELRTAPGMAEVV